MEVLGCSLTCSGSYGTPSWSSQGCTSISHGDRMTGECSGNASSLVGRDCAPFSSVPGDIGSYKGALNLQLAWRRNTIQGLLFPGIPMMFLGPKEGVPLVDGGLIQGNRNATGGAIAVLGLNVTVNVLVA